MVIITDASGNIQAPTIPDNVYQGSNLANEIVFLAPLPQSNTVTITFRKPNGILIEELIMKEMTPYTSVPSEYNLSAWRYVLEDAITDLYGQVTFQIKVRNGQGTVITSVGGTFPVLRGVPSIPSSEPSTSKWQAILDYVASIQADIDNGWLEARGLLPYHEDFEYSLGASVFDKATTSIYTSLIDNNVGNPLSDATKWGKTGIYNGTDQDIQEMIDSAIATHNSSAIAHQDIRNLIAGKQDQLSQAQQTAVDSGIDSTKVSQIATNTSDIGNIQLTIPTLASKDNAVGSIELSINSSTFVVTLQAKNVNGQNIGTAQTIDLPLESVVVNGSYDSQTKKVILTLQNGSTVEFSIADLVAGLQSEITSTNKLSADLVDDTNATNKFVTAGDITTWNGKQDKLTAMTNAEIDTIMDAILV